MANIKTSSELTRDDHARCFVRAGVHFDEPGDVWRCPHGSIFLAIEKIIWPRNTWRKKQLHPIWNRRLYRRALRALAAEERGGDARP